MKPLLEHQVWIGLAMGGPIGLPIWIDAVQQEERRKKLGLDALLACYLILRGPEGLDLIESRFLENPKAEYTHIYSTIMALRFHGDENTGIIPQDRLLSAMRLLLDNQDFADQVVLDLSRWEDWSVMDRLVEMFKKSDEKGYIRQPVVSYLTVASEQPGEVGARAKAAIADLETLDPETVKTARSLMAFGALGRARGMASAGNSNDARPSAAKDGGLTDAQANDATQGFAASPTDDKADPNDIPDPAAYGDSAGADNEASSKQTTTAAEEPADGTVDAQASDPSPIPQPAPSVAVGQFNPTIAAGVPLAAALLLMGIFWLILRAGAM
jgi:hypothetical protein